jgi:hypothetical protein
VDGKVSQLYPNGKPRKRRHPPVPAPSSVTPESAVPLVPRPSLLQTYHHLVQVKGRLLHHMEDLISGERLLHGLVLHQAAQPMAQHDAEAAQPLIEHIEADTLASWRALVQELGALLVWLHEELDDG